MQPLLVLGMHRSGTSLATSLLESAGVNVGQRLLGANASNPRGHFEDEDFVEFQQAALRHAGLNHDGWITAAPPPLPDSVVAHARALVTRKQQAGGPWGWKDPRTVPLLPLWLPLVPGAGFAIVYRAPWEVIESLYRRGDTAFTEHPELAVQVWLHYNRVLRDLALAAPDRSVVGNVETIAQHPAAWVAAVAARTSTPLASPGAAVVEPSLLHGDQARERAGLLYRHYPEVVALYEQLQQLAWRPANVGAPAPWTHHVEATADRRLAMHDWAAAAWAARERRRQASEAHGATAVADDRTPAGWCACCRSETRFIETGAWLRDQFLCERCQSIPRFRAVNHTLDTYFPEWAQAAVHEFTPPTDLVRRHCAHYSHSLLTDLLPQADDTFDLVITQDLLEHVFQPDVTVREIMRVVKPGGAHVFTTPKHKGLRTTRQRARLDRGVVTHLLDPQYHGDPLADDRELVTWDYGDDFEVCLAEWCGLPTVTYVVRDRRLGLDGEYLDVFVTRKPARNFASA